MERPVKERLVGAAVLMAAAVILIPEMLSGPDEDESAASDVQSAHSKGRDAAAGQSNAPIKTYTIDLNHSPGAPATVNVDENRAPPPEETGAASTVSPEAQANPEAAEQTAGAPESVAQSPASEPPAAPSTASTTVVEPPTQPAPAVTNSPPKPAPAVASPPPRPLASTPAVPTSSGWAVQLGSFSKQATAEKLVTEQRALGRDAFVMPVKSGGATLYRVRVGPMKDRAGAEAVLRSVKPNVPGAAVVAHP